MKPLLDTPGRAALREFCVRPPLLALDYDGTLSPIVDDRNRASMRDSTRALLLKVAQRHRLVVISGRARADLKRHLAGIPLAALIGNHGGECDDQPDAAVVARVRAWRAHIEQRLPPGLGVEVEDKVCSLTLHFRKALDQGAARSQLVEITRDLAGVRRFGGKAVLNIVPREAPNKGAALLAACDRLGASAIFVGDDDTDEDIFRLRQPQRVFGVRVGESPDSAADWFLRDQLEVDALLSALADG